jgi:hypothetical protein
MTATKTKKNGGKKGSGKGKASTKKGAKPQPAKDEAPAVADDDNLVPIKRPKAKKDKTKKLSAIDAAAQVLAGAKEPMSCKELIGAMAQLGLWRSPSGATPWATLFSAILREVKSKGKDARFKKTDRGRFTANA